MNEPALTSTDVEGFLDVMEWVATNTAAGFVRWVLVRADPERRIVAETIYPMLGTGWLGPHPKAHVQEEQPWLLDGWAEVDERRFFTSMTSDREVFIHTATSPEAWVVERLHDLLDASMHGDAPDRSREQQLTESDLAHALERWELGVDSVMSESLIEGSRERVPWIAEKRAELRWGDAQGRRAKRRPRQSYELRLDTPMCPDVGTLGWVSGGPRRSPRASARLGPHRASRP